MTHVFLAYSRKDTAFMRRLRDDLRAAGLGVWTDKTGLEPGTPAWEVAIQNAIESAGCLVVVLSPDAKKSLWVTRELNYAEEHGLRIFPLLARGDQKSAVPLRLTSTQRIDARDDYESALRELLRAVRRHLGLKLPPHRVETVPASWPPPARAVPARTPKVSMASVLRKLLARRLRWLVGAGVLSMAGYVFAVVSVEVIGEDGLAAYTLIAIGVLMTIVAIRHIVARRWWLAIPFLLVTAGLAFEYWRVWINYSIDPYYDVEWQIMTGGLALLSLGAFVLSIVNAARRETL